MGLLKGIREPDSLRSKGGCFRRKDHAAGILGPFQGFEGGKGLDAHAEVVEASMSMHEELGVCSWLVLIFFISGRWSVYQLVQNLTQSSCAMIQIPCTYSSELRLSS